MRKLYKTILPLLFLLAVPCLAQVSQTPFANRPRAANAIQFVTPEGSDTNDGLSWGTSKYTVFAACEALPGGAASPATCGHGTIYFTDLSHAHPTTGCGIWLMGSTDPNYASPPTCWLHFSGALDVIGVASRNSGPNPHLPRALLLGGSATDRNHPGVWLSGTQGPSRFANLSIQYPARAFVVGECSNNTRTGTCTVASATFENTTGNLNSVAGNGPCFDITGTSFWIWLKDWGCQGLDGVNTPTDDNAAAVLIDGRTNPGNGLVFLNDGNTSGGGIKVYAGANVSQFNVDGLTCESQLGEPCVWIALSGNSGDNQTMANVFNVQVADATAGTPAFQNDIPGTGPQIVVSNMQFGPTIGPATVLNQRNAEVSGRTISPLREGQTGFFKGHIIGATDLAARQFAPSTVRFTNLAKTDATTWTNSGSQTFTTGITAPDGTTGAARSVSTSGNQYVYLRPQTSTALAAGDYVVAGAWVRSQTANGYSSNAMPISIINAGGTSTCVNNSWVVAGDGQWDWVTLICKILTAPASPYFLALYLQVDTTHAIEAYGPVLNVIPSGTISENEVYAYAAALVPYDKNCAVGTICGLATQLFNPIGGVIFNGAGTPVKTSAFPYTPACMAATTCGGFLALSDLVADSFTRADAATLGANWTTMGGYGPLSIVSNAAVNNGAGSAYAYSYYSAQAFSADQFSQATLSASPTLYDGVGVRVASGDNGYWFYCNTGASYLVKHVAGAPTTLASAFTTCATNDVLRIEVVGTQVTAYKNGAQVSTVSDSALTSGVPGILLYNNGSPNGSFQNFVGGNLRPNFNQPGYWAKMQTFGLGITLGETTAPSGLAGYDVCYGDSTANAVKCSWNNGTFGQMLLSNSPAALTGSWDATGTTLFKLRKSAGLTTSADGDLGYDTTNSNWHAWNGADLFMVPLAAGFVTGNCAQPTNTAGKWVMVDAGNPCGVSAMVYPGAGVPKSTGIAWDTSYTVGTGASNLVQLNGSSQLPAVSAALLTNFPTFNQNTSGTAANLSGTPALPNGTTATTQAGASNDTKLATDAYVDAHFIASGSSALATGAITAGTCATVVTAAATGTLTTDNIAADFNADPTGVTGYNPANGSPLSIVKYPTADTVNFKVCNYTAGSITPGAITLNWRVTR